MPDPDLFSLEGRIALITGGSRGIGKMIAREFVERGATVYVSSRKADVCEETAAELSAVGPGRCEPLPVDASTLEGISTLAVGLGERESRLDVLIREARRERCKVATGCPVA